MKKFAPALLVLAGCFSAWVARAAVAQYDFNGNLNSSSGGLALTTGFAAPASSAGVTYTSVTISAATAQVANVVPRATRPIAAACTSMPVAMSHLRPIWSESAPVASCGRG